MEKFVQHFIIPLARKHSWTSFCEIGASTGVSTDKILKLPIGSYLIIDPCFDADLALKYAADKRVTVLKRNSLDALPHLSGAYDCILIDGDHNWYTVFNELRLIKQGGLLRPGGMIFFHDVEWPNGRRDMYYQPETIPSEFRHEYQRKGILRGKSKLADQEGTNSTSYNATHEGGPRNGVLTAIEDFYAENRLSYNFCRVRLGSGLGILQYRIKQPSESFSFFAIQIKAGIYSIYGLVHRLKRWL